jgi:putative molybdopterin biosynthesis protein
MKTDGIQYGRKSTMPRPYTNDEIQPEFYTVGQLAELLQLTPMTIYRMVRRGELACHAIGRIKRFRRGDVETFLENSRQPASEPAKAERRIGSRQLDSALDN